MRTVIHRPVVVFPYEKLGADFSEGATNTSAKLTANAAVFPNCDPTPPVLAGQVAAFVAADVLTKTNKGAIPAREAQREILWGGLEGVRGSVQKVCDSNPEQAAVYASQAGLALLERHPPVPVILAGALTTTKGAVRLKASLALLTAMLPPVKGKGGRKTILWRYTLDGGKTFVTADSTPFVTTTIAGLPLETDVGFQVALKDRRGTTSWSQTFVLHVY
jgi:hypothetical protein